MFPDGWTVSTEVILLSTQFGTLLIYLVFHKNCARSAQAEHMVLITDKGAEVLTRTPTW